MTCTKVLFSAVLLKVGGLPGRISQNSSDIFLPPRHVLKPPLVCLLIRQQFCAQWPLQKTPKTPKRSLFSSRTVYLFISLLMHLYLYFNEKNLKPCKMFIHVCMYACVYNFHSETQVPLLLFRRSTRSNPPSMFFECRRRG